MSREKWLLGEVKKWEEEGLISGEVSQILRERYGLSKKANILVLFFSIIGTILIGAGIILIFAKNWYRIPLAFKTIISFLPLVLSQAFSFYVLSKRKDSLAFRESASLFMAASVFLAVALVGQTFHLSGDFSSYVLTCGLLFMPSMFILDAVSPLIVYYYTVINWAGIETNGLANAVVLVLAMAAGIYFVYKKRKSNPQLVYYLKTITVIASFLAFCFLSEMVRLDLAIALGCFFILLYALSLIQENVHEPLLNFSILGGFVLLCFLSYQSLWDRFYLAPNLIGACLAGFLLIFSYALCFKKAGDIKRIIALVLAGVIVLSRLVLAWVVPKTNIVNPFISVPFTILVNFYMAYLAVIFIIKGAKEGNIKISNVGLVAICVQVVLRFFDYDFDFLTRGIAFLIMGIAFLVVNLYLSKSKRFQKGEGQK